MAKNPRSTGGIPADNSGAIRALPQVGTDPAKKDKIQGCGLIARKSGWGGARISALRNSLFLTLAQCEKLEAAAKHAEQLGLPFNRHWTVHYESAGIDEANAMAFIRRLLKLSGDYARRNGAQLAAVWCRENGRRKGGHVHILLHMPADLPLKGYTRRWVRLAGGQCRKGVSHVRSIGGNLKAAKSGSEHYRQNVANVRAYLMKGATSATGNALGLERFGIGGPIVGKRCGWTQNIGSAARKRKVQPRDKLAR